MKRRTSLCMILLCSAFLTGCASGETARSEPDPDIVQSADTESAATEPAVTEPAATEPVVTEPLEKPEITDGEKEGWLSCTYAGIRHDMILELPETPDGAPLIVMLPGYGQTAESFRSFTNMDEAAIPRGYAVLYVTGAPQPNDPTASYGWNSGISPEGNPDTAFLKALAGSMQETYGFDSAHTFAAGFSNGGFMMHRLAMECADTFAAVASVAGRITDSVWENRNEANSVGVLQITGEKDEVIPKHSDGTADRYDVPGIEDVMEYWAASNGLSESASETVGNNSVLTKYTGSGTTKQVWDVFIPNGRHSWPNGDYNGVIANELILDFFDAQK